MATNTYREATRIQTSILAGMEKRVLIWIAERLPAWINSDHLTVLAGLAMVGGGICYWIGPSNHLAMYAAIAMLALNWFGDSLDGTVARVRHHERPRYGFYVDHVLDVVGILMLLAGFALGGFMSPLIAAGFLVAYYLLMVEIALATHAVGTFRISFWKFGPTELRILLAIGTLRLMHSSFVTVGGHRMLLFDLSGVIAIGALLLTFILSAASNTRHLYRLEPLPQRVESGDDPRRSGRPALLVKDTHDRQIVGRRADIRSHA